MECFLLIWDSAVGDVGASNEHPNTCISHRCQQMIEGTQSDTLEFYLFVHIS